MATANNIFITGRPGVGKTTALLKALALIPAKVHGFHTREIREAGTRVGFEISDLEGNAAVMAHVDFPKRVRVGKYGVSVEAIEEVGVSALRKALQERTPAVIDEVGKMELSCPAFEQALMQVLDADIPVLGTLHQRQDRVSRTIRQRGDTEILPITAQNRDELPERLARALAGER